MKLRARTSLIFTTLLLAFVTVLLVVGFSYPWNVKIAPFVVGLPTWVLLFLLWLGEVNPEWSLGKRNRGREHAAARRAEESEFTRWAPVVNTLGWIVAFYLLLFLFGFLLVTPVFLSAFLIRKGKVRPLKAIPVAVLTTLVSCGFVQGLFKIDLWLGAVPKLIPHILGGSIVPPL
jgi:uncharacterized membrane protein